jgi:hypothetical protein
MVDVMLRNSLLKAVADDTAVLYVGDIAATERGGF